MPLKRDLIITFATSNITFCNPVNVCPIIKRIEATNTWNNLESAPNDAITICIEAASNVRRTSAISPAILMTFSASLANRYLTIVNKPPTTSPIIDILLTIVLTKFLTNMNIFSTIVFRSRYERKSPSGIRIFQNY